MFKKLLEVKREKQILNDNNCQPGTQDSVKLSFKNEDKLYRKTRKLLKSPHWKDEQKDKKESEPWRKGGW